MSSQNNSVVALPKLYDAGGVIDPKKRWYVYYTYRDPMTGKNKRFRIYEGFNEINSVAKRRAHAEKLIQEWTEKLINGYNPFADESIIYRDDLRYHKAASEYAMASGKVRTIRYLASLYMQQAKSTLRLSSEHSYRSKLRKLTDYLEDRKMKDQDVSVFTSEMANDFIRHLFTEKKLSNKTVNEYIVLLKRVWEYFNLILEAQNRQIVNPWQKMKKFRHEEKKPRVFTMQQIRKLAEVIEKKDQQMWLVIRMLFNCFIRPNEMRFLKIENIDFVSARVMVPAAVAKNKKDEWVDIPEYIIEDMIEMKYDLAPLKYYVFSVQKQPGPKPVSKNYFYKNFIRYRDEAELPPDLILYALKHTGVAELKKTGADWLEIKNQLRHHSLDQVIAYGHSLLGQASEHIRKKGPQI